MPQIDSGVKFHVRYRDASGRFVWSQPYNTLEEARKEATGLELNTKAVSLGLTVEEYKNKANANRTQVRTAVESFIAEAAKTKKKNSLSAYKQHLTQFQESLHGVRFMDEISKKTLRLSRFLGCQRVRGKDSIQPSHDRALTLEATSQLREWVLSRRKLSREHLEKHYEYETVNDSVDG